jgi:hypothetical protein
MRYALVCSIFFICLAFADPVYVQNTQGEGSEFTIKLPFN